MTKRDEFSETTKRLLRDRVANRCSAPTCRKVTSGPNEKSNKSTNIGKAAHITAAAEGGPRYDKKITAELRKSFGNGIWLCANCADLIDKDPENYSVELLHEWKRTAESKAEKEMGKRLPENSDAIDTVTQALTGLPKNYISTAILNVHNSTEASLEILDPRFRVITSYQNETTSLTILPKENDVPFNLKVKTNDRLAPEKIVMKFRELFEHGESITLPQENIEIEGLPLIDEFAKDLTEVSMSIVPHKHNAVQKIWLANSDQSNQIEAFDDIQGFITHGSKSFSFNGEACGGMFEFNYRKELEGTKDIELSLSINLESWDKQNIEYLHYFNKLKNFTDKLYDGWKLYSSLEIKGLEILTIAPIDMSKSELVIGFSSLFQYIECCRTIVKRIDKQLLFKSEFLLSQEELFFVEEIARTINIIQVYKKEQFGQNATFKLIADEQNKTITDKKNELTTVALVQDVTVSMFGEIFELPTKICQFNSVFLRHISADNETSVELVPQKNFSLSILYKNRDEVTDFLSGIKNSHVN